MGLDVCFQITHDIGIPNHERAAIITQECSHRYGCFPVLLSEERRNLGPVAAAGLAPAPGKRIEDSLTGWTRVC